MFSDVVMECVQSDSPVAIVYLYSTNVSWLIG